MGIQNNQVNRNGKIRHLFWGATFYEGKTKKIRDHTYHMQNTYLIRYLDWKLQSEFGFRWEQFQWRRYEWSNLWSSRNDT